MKKNQHKSRFEDRKSVANQCDYSRSNGKCGRAMCDNFGKLCPGRSCEDWSCDAEGTAVTVVEPSGGAVGMTEQDVAAGIKRQCKVIEDAEKNAQLERAKLGVILIRWEQYLGEARGRGKAGEGLKGWLEENVPELNYKTAVNYKSQAEMALKMLGGGAKAQAVLLDEPTVTQPDGEVIEIEAEYVAKRDKIFEDVKSRRQLEQTYFKFMASEGRRGPGRPKGTTKPVPENYAAAHKTNEENAATAYAILWRELDKKRQLPNLASLLSIEDARSIHELIKPVFEALRKRVLEAE